MAAEDATFFFPIFLSIFDAFDTAAPASASAETKTELACDAVCVQAAADESMPEIFNAPPAAGRTGSATRNDTGSAVAAVNEPPRGSCCGVTSSAVLIGDGGTFVDSNVA